MTREELKTAKPILFNTSMVKAILDGRKTQTRRVIKQKDFRANDNVFLWDDGEGTESFVIRECAKYKKGDILYVRETFATPTFDSVVFKADFSDKLAGVWSPSTHMPKEYARIFLKVTDVRVERLCDILVKNPNNFSSKVKALHDLFQEAGADGYKLEDDPYVFVYEFERIEI